MHPYIATQHPLDVTMTGCIVSKDPFVVTKDLRNVSMSLCDGATIPCFVTSYRGNGAMD